MSEKEDIFIDDFYNMILGGLIALKSAQQAGICQNSLTSETIFLGKWLKRVKKQKCYPKTVANEIEKLLAQYAKKGQYTELSLTFDKLYLSFQSDEIKTVLKQTV